MTVSLPADLLEALDAVAEKQMRNRSQQLVESLKNDPDVDEVLEGLREATKVVSNE